MARGAGPARRTRHDEPGGWAGKHLGRQACSGGGGVVVVVAAAVACHATHHGGEAEPEQHGGEDVVGQPDHHLTQRAHTAGSSRSRSTGVGVGVGVAPCRRFRPTLTLTRIRCGRGCRRCAAVRGGDRHPGADGQHDGACEAPERGAGAQKPPRDGCAPQPRTPRARALCVSTYMPRAPARLCLPPDRKPTQNWAGR